MADWKQIQARIRRAKASADALAMLSELFTKTHDPMVAFEIGGLYEKSGQNEEAARWFTAAAVRFRRTEWKKKAEEALVRLGAPVPPAASGELPAPEAAGAERAEVPREGVADQEVTEGAVPEIMAIPEAEAAKPAKPARSRRGRRGGRGRGRGRGTRAPHEIKKLEASPAATPAEVGAEPSPARSTMVESPAAQASWQSRARAGDPALASRMAQLEAQLRRLIASPLHALDEADTAPAGPGVFLLSDSDQTTNYHIEDCRTLRIALGNLGRGERGSRGEGSLRAKLAEHLGISESRVSKYLKEHCAVRWVQLDEGASHLAHFAISLLRPALDT